MSSIKTVTARSDIDQIWTDHLPMAKVDCPPGNKINRNAQRTLKCFGKRNKLKPDRGMHIYQNVDIAVFFCWPRAYEPNSASRRTRKCFFRNGFFLANVRRTCSRELSMMTYFSIVSFAESV
jgi:hypothetical protein